MTSRGKVRTGVLLLTLCLLAACHPPAADTPPPTATPTPPPEPTPTVTPTPKEGEEPRSFSIDANFDGNIDFCYAYSDDAEHSTVDLYLWDEQQKRFVFAQEFLGNDLRVNEHEQTVECVSNSSNMTEIYRWENGELVCFRKIQATLVDAEYQSVEYVTYELADGQWQEVWRETYAMQGL